MNNTHLLKYARIQGHKIAYRIGKPVGIFASIWRAPTHLMPEMQKPISDLVVDGTKTQEKIADEILAHINTFNHCGALIDGSYIKIATKSDLHYANKYLRQKFVFCRQYCAGFRYAFGYITLVRQWR